MIWKPNFDIWWHRVIVTSVIGAIIGVGMYFINEKPFSEESQLKWQELNESGGHFDPTGTPEGHHDDDDDHVDEPGTPDDHHDE